MRRCAPTSGCSARSSGRVLIEQEGEEVYRLEERIRLLARLGRRGDAGASRALAETIAGLDVETQAVVLRAFTVYFHLANIAEQHHRVRRRREYEREGGTLRESLAEALALLDGEGVPARGSRCRGRAGCRVELVLTAHPTEALPRTILEKHRRIAGLLEQLDDARLTPVRARGAAGGRSRRRSRSSGRPTRCGRERPRVVDEIRQALWFLEDSLWDAAPTLLAAWRERAPGRAAALRHVDRRRHRRQPERRRRDGARGASSAARRSSASSSAATSAQLAASWGMSSTLVEADDGRRSRRASGGPEP